MLTIYIHIIPPNLSPCTVCGILSTGTATTPILGFRNHGFFNADSNACSKYPGNRDSYCNNCIGSLLSPNWTQVSGFATASIPSQTPATGGLQTRLQPQNQESLSNSMATATPVSGRSPHYFDINCNTSIRSSDWPKTTPIFLNLESKLRKSMLKWKRIIKNRYFKYELSWYGIIGLKRDACAHESFSLQILYRMVPKVEKNITIFLAFSQ